MSPHPTSLGGCSLLSARRTARVRPLSGATYFMPQASGYWACSVDSKSVPSSSNGKSTTSLSLSFVSDTWTNDMLLTGVGDWRRLENRKIPHGIRQRGSTTAWRKRDSHGTFARWRNNRAEKQYRTHSSSVPADGEKYRAIVRTLRDGIEVRRKHTKHWSCTQRTATA